MVEIIKNTLIKKNVKETQKSERENIKKSQKGDAEAFALLYEKYSPKIYRFIYYRLNNKEQADDAIQEVFIKAWENIKNYKIQKYPFSAWLYRIAKNLIIDHWRTAKHHIALDTENEIHYSFQLAGEQNEINSLIDGQIEMAKIKKALNELNDIQKETIILRFINDLDITEVAEIINKSVSTSRVIQHRALKNLKKILESQEQNFA